MPIRSSSARFAWGDRNPSTNLLSYLGGGVAPHGLTARAAYTVPTGKKAVIQNFSAVLWIATAATTAGKREIIISFSSVADVRTGYAYILGAKNTIGDTDRVMQGLSGLLLAGESAQIITSDNGVGGTIDYTTSVSLTEFDS